MTIRKAKPSDAASIAAISVEVWVSTYLKQGVNAFFADYVLREFTTSKMAEQLSHPEKFTLVSQNQQGIDGFIQVSSPRIAPVDGCSDVEVSTFYVQPRHHGKGIGKRLLRAALQHCRKQSADSVWLTTNAENDPAIAFYLAQGFTHVGEIYFHIEDGRYLNNVYLHRLEC